MSNNLERLLDAERDRLAHLPTDQLPVLTGAMQTRLSWARTVDRFDALPAVYQAYMTALLQGRPWPYAVLTPTYAGFMRREKEQLIFSLDDQLYIVERDTGRLNPIAYPLADVNYFEAGSILLKSWIRVSGVSDTGRLASTTLKFNAVTERLFAPFVEQFRVVIDPAPEVDRGSELNKFDYLMQPNFKFMNYARRSVLPGVHVIDTLLQPEMRQPLVTLFGRTFSRLTATAHLDLLTSTELIVIRDDEDAPAWQSGIRHGGVWTYIPLARIARLNLTEPGAGPLALTIELPHDDRVQLLFARDQHNAVERFLHQVIEWAPEAALTMAPAASTASH